MHQDGRPAFLTYLSEAGRASDDPSRNGQFSDVREHEIWLQPKVAPALGAVVRLVAVRDPSGAVTELCWLIRENTRQREAEMERYRRVIEEVRDYAIFTMDPEGHVLTWNTGAEIILSYRPTEILGQLGAIIFTDEEREAGEPEKERQQAAATGRDGRRMSADISVRMAHACGPVAS